MLEGFLNLNVGNKIIFHDNFCGVDDIEKNRICDLELHKILSESEAIAIDRGINSISVDGTLILENNKCYILDFYNSNRIFRCNSYITSIYSEDGYRFYKLKISSPFIKLNRRMHQRYSYRVPLSYSVLKNSQVHDIIDRGLEKQNIQSFKHAQLSDISGGGIRFTSRQKLKKGNYIFCTLDFDGFNGIKSFSIVGRVINTEKIAKDRNLFETRLEYFGITEQQREQIIHFIFWLERQNI